MSLKLLLPLILLLIPKISLAHCPICVAATGSAVAVARFYGVPDLVIGTFVGAFIASVGSWTSLILTKRKIYLPFQNTLIPLFVLLLFSISFHLGNIVTTLYDKFFIGMVVGIFVTLIAFNFSNFLRKRNKNKNFMPFQVIFVTFSFLLSTILICWVGGFV
jgi:hypothetical protein